MLHNLGLMVLAQGDVDLASTYLRESLRVCQELGDLGLVGRCLMALVGVVGATGRMVQAARLYGAAQAVRAVTGMDEGELNRESSQRYLAATRAALGEVAFSAATVAGGALPLDEAIAEAFAASALAADTSHPETDPP